jgi:hypothetical protein
MIIPFRSIGFTDAMAHTGKGENDPQWALKNGISVCRSGGIEQ